MSFPVASTQASRVYTRDACMRETVIVPFCRTVLVKSFHTL